MKKFFAAMLALMMLVTICAAHAEECGNPQISPEFYLPGNPTTGYTWTAETEDADVVNVLVEYLAPDTDAVGAPGNFWVRIDGLKEGLATVKLTYARPWENCVPMYSMEIMLIIDADLNATITQIEFAQPVMPEV